MTKHNKNIDQQTRMFQAAQGYMKRAMNAAHLDNKSRGILLEELIKSCTELSISEAVLYNGTHTWEMIELSEEAHEVLKANGLPGLSKSL